MSKEEKFLQSCIKLAKEAKEELGYEHCQLPKDYLAMQKLNLDVFCKLANDNGYKLVEQETLSEDNDLPDAKQNYMLVPIDTPTTA